MAKVPFKKLLHEDGSTNRLQGNVEEAINKIGTQTQDDWPDGRLYRRLKGVNHDNLLTNSGIASNTITGDKIDNSTILVASLAPAGQFLVYRSAAFSCPASAYSALLADKIVKDTAGGYSSSTGLFTVPTAGDWQFSWNAGATLTNDAKQCFSALVVNSGVVDGTVSYSSGASQTILGGGTFLYCNALVGDKIKVQVWNGDTGAVPMFVGSGANFFCGYQVR